MVAEGLFCPRSGNEEQKQKIVDMIKDRQDAIESGKSNMSPICIFPEGATSNNTVIGTFHRGAFESLCAVRPVTFKYKCPQVHVSNDVIADPDVCVLLACCVFPSFCEVKIHPVFKPNEHLFSDLNRRHVHCCDVNKISNQQQ